MRNGPYLLPSSAATVMRRGPFLVRRVRPGSRLPGHENDPGLGPLGLVDHATLLPGLLVPMHQHRDDEILSYLRTGTMWHVDSSGGRVALTNRILAAMNAGAGLAHEESIPADGAVVEMLQVFFRPSAPGLAPKFQSHEFATAHSTGHWRLVAGPADSAAPLALRSAGWFYDARITAGETAPPLPVRPGHDGWIYVFHGRVRTAHYGELTRGDSLRLLDGFDLGLEAVETSDVVFVRVDPQAPYTLAGDLSG